MHFMCSSKFEVQTFHKISKSKTFLNLREMKKKNQIKLKIFQNIVSLKREYIKFRF